MSECVCVCVCVRACVRACVRVCVCVCVSSPVQPLANQACFVPSRLEDVLAGTELPGGGDRDAYFT